MKNKVLLLSMLLISIIAFSQGRRADQSGVHAQFGYMLPKDTIGGQYMVKVGYDRVMGDNGFLGKAELFFQDYKVSYTDNQILPYQKYGVSVSGGYSYEALHPVYFNGYLGAFGAYENANKGIQTDALHNADIPAKVTGFTFGLTGSIEVEVIVARRLSVLVDYTQFYDFKSKFSKANYGFFGGLKYYIN